VNRAAAPRTDPEPEFEPLQSAARRIGYSVDLLRDKVATGELPAYRVTEKPGARIVLRVADVNALLKPVMPQAVYDDRSRRPRSRNGQLKQ
jgi:hypothetical protein